MKPKLPPFSCDCCSDHTHGLTRRDFLKTTVTGLTAAAAGSLPIIGVPRAAAAPKPTDRAETLAASLYKSLREEQRRAVCFPFDHPLRLKVDNNWHITDRPIKELFTKDEQAIIREIFLGIHSPEYADAVLKQVEHDNSEDGGFGGSAIAFFGSPRGMEISDSRAGPGRSIPRGEPGSGKFEFVFTGRHVTRRCDGDSVAGAAFGGPIFYGHAPREFNEKPDHPDNVYWYQARRANELFKALDGKQRELALLGTARKEEGTKTVQLTGQSRELPGLPASELAPDQKDLVRKVMADVLAPFRKADADEALKLIEKNGFDHLHLAFYKNQDIGNDGVWDVWQIEGPSMVWYFRGEPHVHVWVHVRDDAKQA